MTNQTPQQTSHIGDAQLPIDPNPDDHDKSWKQAFRNTVFSQYCPPKSERKKPPSFIVCDFQGSERKKKVFNGQDCEDRARVFLEEPAGDISHRIIFIENPTTTAIRATGVPCNLYSGDWLRATRWVNLPESLKFNTNGTWMFLDLITMWKKPGKKRKSGPPEGDDLENPKQSIWQGMATKWLRKFVRVSHRPDKAQKTSSTWHRRRIGVLYSKQDFWVYIVLIQPGDDDWKFCYRIIKDAHETAPNAHCTGGLRFYNGAEASLEDAINYFTIKLKDVGPGFLENILQDVFWGWEEYLQHVRSQTMSIRNVCQLRENKYSFDHADCWKLFDYKLTLMEAKCLSRVIKYLEKAKRAGEAKEPERGKEERKDKYMIMAVQYLSLAFKSLERAGNEGIIEEDYKEKDVDTGKGKEIQGTKFELPINLENLRRCLETLTDDTKTADELLTHTIQMIYNYMAIRKADFAARSGHNMEYLAFLAAVFFPLTLFTGIFGMNITELNNSGPHWPLVVKVTVPSTIILFILIYVGKFAWTWVSGRAKSGGDLQPSPYFVGDKRGPDSRTFSSIQSFQNAQDLPANNVAEILNDSAPAPQ